MTKALAVFRFELGYQLRRPSTLVYVVGIFAMCMSFLHMMAQGSANDGTYFNSPFAVMVTVVFGSMLALLIVAALASDAATRDAELRMDSLFYTSPVGKRAYFAGRFLGIFCVSALLLLALPAGILVAAWMPWVDPQTVGPVRASAYLAPYFLLALPNAFVATALLFGMATLTRRAMASYAGAALVFFTPIVCEKLLAPRIGWSAAKMLDPLGFTYVQELWKSLNALQKNALALTLDGALATNRLLWLAVALMVLTLAYARLRFAHAATGRGSSSKTDDDEGRIDAGSIAVPPSRRVFDGSTRMRQLLAIAMRSFAELHASRAWGIVPLLALMFILSAPELAELEMGVPGPLSTPRVVDFFSGDMALLLTLLIALSAGELVWRERGARMHALAGVTPVPDWLPVIAKFLAIALMLVATQLIFLVAGVAVQTIAGGERYELALYVQLLFGMQLPEYLLTAALAMIVHVLVNQKYVANALIVLTPFARELARALGVEDNLLLYGGLPAWVYSDMAGFSPAIRARLWFTLYHGGWALLFALVAYLFWIRGEENDVRRRLALARHRLTRAAATIGATALAIIAGVGGFIFSHTHDHPSAAEIEQQRAEYERRYGRYASLAQPTLTATKLHVDFHPQRLAATVRGSYRLENRGSARIDTIHVATAGGPKTTDISFDRAARVTVADEEHDYRIYTLDRALEPGESLRMDFRLGIVTGTFSNYGSAPVARNGSLLMHRPGKNSHWLPLIGYQAARELNNAAVRKKYGLRTRHPYPRLGDVAVGREQMGYEKVALETIIGTDAGQIGVAPGEMRRTWVERGRRYVHYVTDRPISNAWTITAGNYAVHRSKWGNVDIEIFHHPTHTANVERMAHSARASLDYNTRQFGPYQHRLIRLVEFPSDSYWLGMTAHDGLITFAEGFSFVRPDPRDIDFPFAVVAHELSHQWFGHQLTPASVEGAPFLAESLSWYAGMLVVEETFGRAHVQRILTMMRKQYLGPNQPRATPLLRAADDLEGYRVGPFAMYALRENVGVETVNRALRKLLAKFPAGRAPYPTSLDFYAELRAAIPEPMHGLLKDLFEEITFWELRATRLDVKGTRVTLHVDAQKLKGDGTGIERPVPMNDAIEIALYDADGKSVYRGRHRIRSGAQTIELVVARPPARAELDPDRELLERNSEDNAVER